MVCPGWLVLPGPAWPAPFQRARLHPAGFGRAAGSIRIQTPGHARSTPGGAGSAKEVEQVASYIKEIDALEAKVKLRGGPQLEETDEESRAAKRARTQLETIGIRSRSSSPVWKSSFKRPTPSMRRCPRHSLCSMAWRITNLTHWLISTQTTT